MRKVELVWVMGRPMSSPTTMSSMRSINRKIVQVGGDIVRCSATRSQLGVLGVWWWTHGVREVAVVSMLPEVEEPELEKLPSSYRWDIAWQCDLGCFMP